MSAVVSRRYWELLYFLTLKSIKVRYKQTVLGVLWVVLRPFLMMVVFTIIFSRIARFPSDNIPYPLFSYAAILPWTLFAGGVTLGVSSLVNHAGLIRQIYFPREIFPASAVLASLFDFAVSSVLFAGLCAWYGVALTPVALYALPLVALLVCFTLAVGLFGATINVYYRDVSQVISFALQMCMYAVPVIYPVSAIPEQFRPLYMLNPLAVIINGFRRVLLQGLAPEWRYIGIAVLVTGVLFVGSVAFIRKMEMKFADII